jgi:nitroreductase
MTRRQLLIGGGVAAAIGAGTVYGARVRMGSSSNYDAATAAMRAPLPDPAQTLDLVRCATLAASSHNTQPWLFHASPNEIRIAPDRSRRTPIVDPDDHHLFTSLGCAAENLAIAAARMGQAGVLTFDPAGGGSILFSHQPTAAAASPLFDAISRRQSTRAEYDQRLPASADLDALRKAAAVPGVDLLLITDRPEIDRIRDLVLAGNSAQFADPAFLRELKAWLRFSPRYALDKGDGLYSATTGNAALPEWLGSLAFDWFVSADSENDRYARQMRSSAGVAVFVGERADPEHWLSVGRACQRFALQATALGIRTAFINQPVEVAAVRPDLARLIGMPGRRPDIVMRFGYGPAMPFSARRPAREVIIS